MRIFQKIIFLLLLLSVGCARAEETAPIQFTAHIGVRNGTVEVVTKNLQEEIWLFLPAFAKQASQIELYVGDEKLSWSAERIDENTELWLTKHQNEKHELHVMRSANLRSVYLFSDDLVNEGREYIDGSPDHSTRTTGSIAMIDADGTIDYIGKIREIRGRGNGTWSYEKKPYQFKLEDRVDLLKTNVPAERNRTWTLLTNASDASHLHNRIALDLGLELGMEQTSRSESVDVYYDGDYLGIYVLAEKVQINEGRIDVTDYEELIEQWNESVGQFDLSHLPVKEGVNRFNNSFSYIEGIRTAGDPDEGSYQIELETSGKNDEKCYFSLNEGRYRYVIKNPEYASCEMMQYVSERLQEAQQTVKNRGIHPETGRTLEDDFNVDGFARLALIAEFTYNLDAFVYGSTWFVLPANTTRFEPGPVWDVDLSLRYLSDGKNDGGEGLKDEEGWLRDFYGCSSFLQAMQSIYKEEMYPLIQEVLLGNGQGRYLKSLDAYVEETKRSVQMDRKCWEGGRDARLEYGLTYEDDISLLRQFMQERSEWLYRVLVTIGPDTVEMLELDFDIIYGHADQPVCRTYPWTPVEISCETELLSEADEMDYAWYRADIYIDAKGDRSFQVPQLTVNRNPISYEILEDGRIHFAVEYEDISYRPVYYGDVDIGLVYNHDVYMELVPDVVEKFEYDDESIIEYFCTVGMEEKHCANKLFSPSEVRLLVPAAANECTTPSDYYWALLDHGYEDGWLLKLNKTFKPELYDVL